jgi:hypothetical protein
MTSRLVRAVPSLLVVLSVAVTGCSSASAGEAPAVDPAVVVETGDGDQPARITLTEEAEQRLGIETKPVVSRRARTDAKPVLVIPYAAVVYDADGKAWAFASTGPRTYQRQQIVVAGITGESVTLTRGPKPGTQVVVVAASELVGAEAGISGEE